MKRFEHLAQRMRQLQKQQTPGVSIVTPGEGGTYRLMVSWGNSPGRSQQRETIHETHGEAVDAYHRFLQAHHTTDSTAPLIIIDT